MTPRDGASFRSTKYPNLYKYPKRSRFWVYRRFSTEKNEDFTFSTGEEKNERAAHTIGEAAYHNWLGQKAKFERGGLVLFGDYAQEHLDRKLARPLDDFSKNSRRISKNATKHLIEAFGHLPIDQVTEDRWEDQLILWDRKQPGVKIFNRRKEMSEILRRAHRNGLIKILPTLRNPDARKDVGIYIPDAVMRRLLRQASSDTRDLIELLWRQGPRPHEALAYSWSMFSWDDGLTGSITIPPEITKTRRGRTIPLNSRVSGRLRARARNSDSRWVFPSPERQKGKDFHIVEPGNGWDGAKNRAHKRLVASEARARKSGRTQVAKQIAQARTILEQGTLYDLRRTFITNCARAGKDRFWVAKYIDTSVKMIERIYEKVQQDVLRGVAE